MLSFLLVAAALCPPGDLAQMRPVSGAGLRGDPSVVTRATVVRDGTAWDTTEAVKVDAGGEVAIELGERRLVGALALQADNDDEYVVDGSLDGMQWTTIWTAEIDRSGAGLRTRHIALRSPVEVTMLRVRPRAGDGNYSVGRLRALCQAPSEWEHEWLQALSPVHFWRTLNNEKMVAFKGWLAFAGALLLLVGALLEWTRRAKLYKRTRDTLLIILAVISCASWFNLFHFHFDGFVHDWEFFHYYLGAKYFPEIGYTHLYECTTAAELEVFGRARLEGRAIRNLSTNQLESAQPVLDNPASCTDRFTPQRWRGFVGDVMYFRSHYSTEKWNDVIHDHGYNATPVWGLAGRALASSGPATVDQIESLAMLDPLLLAIMWCFALWAFGWRSTAVAMLWWGTNYPARYLWNGGAYLRMDWLALAVIGVCLVRKDKREWGGAALTTSALLRIFPGFIVVAIVCKAGWELVREKKITHETKRFVLGCVTALLVLVPASVAVCGTAAYPAFIANSKKHLATALTNNMGWKTVVAYQQSTRVTQLHDGSARDPFHAWKAMRLQVFEQRKVIFYLGLLGFLALITWSTRGKPDWIALALGAGLVPIASELTCYYYSFFLLFGFLWQRQRAIGVALLSLSALTCAIAGILGMEDEQFFWISILVVLFAAGSAVLIRLADTGEGDAPVSAAQPARPTRRSKRAATA